MITLKTIPSATLLCNSKNKILNHIKTLHNSESPTLLLATAKYYYKKVN